MAPKSRSSFGAGKGKGGRRQNVRPKSRGGVPLLPIVVGSTLGQFFDVWSAWSTAKGGEAQKLDGTHVSTITLGPTDKMVIYIDLGDGKGATVYTGDPRAIPLKQHEVITIEVTPPDVNPPPK